MYNEFIKHCAASPISS